MFDALERGTAETAALAITVAGGLALAQANVSRKLAVLNQAAPEEHAQARAELELAQKIQTGVAAAAVLGGLWLLFGGGLRR